MGSIAIVSKRTTDETGCNDSPPEDEAIANALLIAAAPELANALDDLVLAVELPGDHSEIPGALELAKAALAKVRGGLNT